MDPETFLQAIRESLIAIVEPRFYQNERGFQGQFIIELSKRIPEGLPENSAIIEQEHQKTLQYHGLTIRPDVIIHQPFNPAIHTTRQDGNFAVIELKLKAGPKKATEDFASLHKMLTILRYQIGIFINIGHSRPHENYIPADARGHIIAFATRLTADGVQIVEARA